MSELPQSENGYKDAQIVRSMIEHENNLQNYRLTWLMTIQGLLLAALGFAWEKQDARTLVTVFCLLGMCVSVSSWSALRLSSAAFHELYDWWKAHKKNYDGPPIIGHKAEYKFIFWVLRPWRMLPWMFVLGWLIVLILNLRRV